MTHPVGDTPCDNNHASLTTLLAPVFDYSLPASGIDEFAYKIPTVMCRLIKTELALN